MAPNFQNGKIYCIRRQDDAGKIVYIGSTVRPLGERMAEHRDSAKLVSTKFYDLMNQVGSNQFYIELLRNFPCKT